MIDKFIPPSQWTLITIEDPAYLPGKSFFDLMQILLSHVKFNYVVMDNLDGAPIKNKTWPNITINENIILNINEFLDILLNVKQFDWGDFYLFEEYPIYWENEDTFSNYPKLIIQTDITIRAVDDYYMCIYAKYKIIIDEIKKNYKIESIKTAPLNELDYPC